MRRGTRHSPETRRAIAEATSLGVRRRMAADPEFEAMLRAKGQRLPRKTLPEMTKQQRALYRKLQPEVGRAAALSVVLFDEAPR